jgi:hypothetical protein
VANAFDLLTSASRLALAGLDFLKNKIAKP